MFGNSQDKSVEKKYSIKSMDVDTENLTILEQYKVGQVTIYITADGRYLVKEPSISDSAGSLYDVIIKKIDMGVGLDDKDVDDEIIAAKLEDSFWDTAKRLKKFDEAKEMFPNLRYFIKRDQIGFDIIDPLMKDDNIEDILCSAYGRDIRVVHKKYSGRFHTLQTNVKFSSIQEMERFIQRIYGMTGTEPTDSKPMSVTYMADGSRISSTFGNQITKPGPVIAIRKFPKKPFTITHMIKTGTITAAMAAYIWTLLDAKAVGLVIGVTGSGKTTLLSSFISMMNPSWRILTVEDTLELQIPHTDWVRCNTRKSYGMLSTQFDITVRDLINVSLTQKPDYEIVGEIRLDDMDTLFQSVGTGHGGLTSFHASSPEGALTRMRGNKISEGELALLWFVTHSAVVKKRGYNTRKVMNISEIVPDSITGKIKVVNVFRYDIFKDIFQQCVSFDGLSRYNEALQICGIQNGIKDMQKRIDLLNQCVNDNALDIKEVFNILGKYYTV